MARSANSRVTRETPAAKPSTSRRPRAVPKTKDDGEERQLEIEETEETDSTDVADSDESDDSNQEAAPPEPKRRGRKPGTKAAKPAASGSKLQKLVGLAEEVMTFGAAHDMHPVDVLNAIEGVLKATGDIDA